jgi:hypothetical protein
VPLEQGKSYAHPYAHPYALVDLPGIHLDTQGSFGNIRARNTLEAYFTLRRIPE